MPGAYLPPVVTRLSMDLGDFAAKVAEAKAMMKGLGGDAEIKVNADLNKASLAAALTQVVSVTDSFNGANVRIGAEINEASLLAALAEIKAAVSAINAVGAEAGAGGAAAGAGFRLFGWLTPNALHWIIAGGAEILAVTVPAFVALGAAAAVAMQGVMNVDQHMEALYTATEATNRMFGQTVGTVLGTGDALQKAQDAANPEVYSVLGSAIITVKEHFGNLAQTGLQVTGIFQTFAAKVATDFAPGGSLGTATDELLSHMVSDVTQLGQVFGNLGHALLSFASQMPGLAEILLGSLAGITKMASEAIQFAANFRIAGASILTLAMGFEEFNRWGGLMASTLTKMGLASAELTGGPFSFARMGSVIQGLLSVFPLLVADVARFAATIGAGGIAKGLTGFSESLAGAIENLTPLQAGLVAAAAIGLGIFIDKMVTAQTATQRFVASLQTATEKASNLQSFQTIAQNVAQLNAQLAQTPHFAQDAGGTIGQQFKEATDNANFNALNAGLRQQEQDLRNVAQGAQYLANTYHTNLVTALGLADAANVKLANGILGTSAAAQVARMQIASYVQGMQAMGAPMSAVGSDITALAIQSGLASTKVSELNQAWDQFMQNLTGGTSGLASFVQSMTNIGNVVGTVKNNLGQASSITLNTQQFANALKSMGGEGAQAWTNFNQVVGSTAPQLIDWMRTAGAEGALSGQQFKQGVLDMVSALIPLASQSQTAQAEVMGLVDQVDPSIQTWGQLKTAIKNSGASLSGLNPLIDTATQKMGNMSTVAQNLGTATQTALLSVLSSAKVMASGVGTAMQQYEQALMNGSSNTGALKASVLLDFEKMGYSAQQAEQIINAAIAGITPSKTITLTITTQNIETGTTPLRGINSSAPPLPGHAAGTPAAPSGWAWVGEAGPELVRFRGGETVLPHNVSTGFANGAGYMPEVHNHIYLDGREITSIVQKQSVKTQRRTGHNGMQKRTR